MRAVVIGAGWGQVHVAALRAHGVQVVGLAGAPDDLDRTRAAAEVLDVPAALAGLGEVRDLGPDLVTVATPARTHVDLLTALADQPVLCEKPLAGLHGPLPDLDRRPAPLFVNYAFAFLDPARELRARLGTRVHRVEVDSVHDLPLTFTPAEWFLEAASHPLSFLVRLLGDPVPAGGGVEGGTARVYVTCGNVPVALTCRHKPGLDGMRHRVVLHAGDGRWEVEGGYTGREPWRFGPLRHQGRDVGPGPEPGVDAWRRANEASIGTVVAVLRGELAEADAQARGLLSPRQALAIDRCARAVLG